ncbi:ABC transporter ATP-binding protein [Fenollaria timonensis]|uniref:ABC transporter ATP-binding protein n=1 Tax=Fenollaria timonensis TaxID=1723384 RepID=UPI00071D014C|nr:ABC transporter ATP-binding protein [Fenollaria timonensis]
MFKSLKPLLKYFRKYKVQYILGIFFLLFIDVVQLYIPQILKYFANDYQRGVLTMASATKYAILTIVTGLMVAVARYFWRNFIIGNSMRVDYDLRKDFFWKLTSLSQNFFNTHKTGDLMSLATNDINAVRMTLGQGIIMFIDSTFLLILNLVMMIKTTNVLFASKVLFTIPLIILIVMRFGGVIHSRFKAVQAQYGTITDRAQENFSGIRIIKAFGQEEENAKLFREENQNYYDKNIELAKLQSFFNPFIHVLSNISYMLLLFFGAKEVMAGTMLLGDFIAFNAYLGLMMWPARALGMVIVFMQRGAASMDRLTNIFRTEPEIVDREGAIELDEIKGNIEFKNVSFKYAPELPYALKDISFKIEPGKTLAILGRTGSGKSSIVNVLLRLYDINEGEILVDGHDVKDVTLNSLRENISYVPQDDFLFSKTVKENIEFHYEHKLDDEMIEKYAKIAGVYDDIIEFKDGFDTILGERGVTLSGGQKQRVSIARALAKEKNVLIMDDSLSAVDTQTEEEILKNLNTDEADVSKIIISHRVSTIKDADEILFIEDGAIVERGTHDELVSLGGRYNKLYEDQLLEQKINRGDE